MIVSEKICIYNKVERLAVAKFNDLYFFEFSNDEYELVEQIVLDENQVKGLIKDLEEVVGND